MQAAQKGAYPLKQMQAFTKNYLDSGGIKAFSEYYATDHQHAYFQTRMKGNLMFAQHNLVSRNELFFVGKCFFAKEKP